MKKKLKKIVHHVIFWSIMIVLVVLSFLFIGVIRKEIARKVYPDESKQFYARYELSDNSGEKIPSNTKYVTDNGKLFSFCNAISSVVIAALFCLFGMIINRIMLKEDLKINLSRFIRFYEVLVVLLAVFTFTSQVNPKYNIDEYETNSTEKQKIGYIEKTDLQTTDARIPVYNCVDLESDWSGGIVRNIDKYNEYARMTTVVLGALMFVLKDYQRNFEKEPDMTSDEKKK